jgi:hypothetical protein
MANPAERERGARNADLGTRNRIIEPIDGLQHKASTGITRLSQAMELVRASASANEGNFGNDEEGVEPNESKYDANCERNVHASSVTFGM